LKYLNGSRFVILQRYEAALPTSTKFYLIVPFGLVYHGN